MPPAALALFTLVLYAGSIRAQLIYWDDVHYLFYDVRIGELSPVNAWRILTQSFIANYHPVTTFTYAFDRAVWGDWLPGFHLTQLAFYAGGVVMVYFLFAAILASRPAAFAGAAVYAAHTLHVEPVAWLASRKDVVCLLFYAAAILAYVSYTRQENRSWRRYAVFLALAVVAMFSKGYAAVLPAVLLAYDASLGKKFGRRQIVDKLPLLALGLLLTLVMVRAQERDATPVPGDLAFWHRSVAQCKIYAAYVGRTFLPLRLSVNYHHVVGDDWLNPAVAVLGLVLGALTVVGFFLLRRRLPAAAFGIAMFLLQLCTVLNPFVVLRQWMTDRYLFFPTIGSTLALAAGALWLRGNRAVPEILRRWAVPAAAVATVVLYGTLTVGRIGVWGSEVDVWSDAVRKQLGLRGSGPLRLSELEGQRLPYLGSFMNVVQAYERAGRKEEARALVAALGDVPEELSRKLSVMLYFARLDVEAGRYDEAIRKLRPVAEQDTVLSPSAWDWIGEAYRRKGDRDQARAAHERALESYRRSGRPTTLAMIRLGTLEFEVGRFERAAEWYRRAREEAAPNDPRPAFNLALALERLGKLEEARRLCGEALGLEGRVLHTIRFDFTGAYVEMGVISEKLGHSEEAVRHFEEALRRAPDHPQRAGIEAKLKTLRKSLREP